MVQDVKLFADFNNADTLGRIRLSNRGTISDIERLNIKLSNGLEVLLDDGDGLATIGIVGFSEIENIWVARISWDKFTK